MLITTWFEDPTRPTRDIDLLGFGDADSEAMIHTFREIIQVDAADGMIFEPDSLRIDRIREDDRYGGVRLRTQAVLAGARIPVVIDIGFGDAIEPGLELLVSPHLLNFPVPQLRAFARETVLAEKLDWKRVVVVNEGGCNI